MTEQQGFGVYYPESARHQPFNDAMAAWRNEVRSANVTQPPAEPVEESQEAAETPQETLEAASGDETPTETPEDAQGGSEEAGEGVQDESDADPGSTEADLFDPGQHNAPVVTDYLKDKGVEETTRVLEMEKAGKARKGILNLEADLLSEARNNDLAQQ